MKCYIYSGVLITKLYEFVMFLSILLLSFLFTLWKTAKRQAFSLRSEDACPLTYHFLSIFFPVFAVHPPEVLLQPPDNPLFQPGNVGLRDTDQVGHLLLGVFAPALLQSEA